MSISDTLDRLRWALHERLLAFKATAYREGAVHERVRLYQAAHADLTTRWHPFVRAKAEACHRVIEEARAHEESMRDFTVSEERALAAHVGDLAAALRDALGALGDIAGNAADPMEVAARALDAIRAGLDRYAPPTPPTAQKTTSVASLHVEVRADTSELSAELTRMQREVTHLEERAERARGAVFSAGEPVALDDAVSYEAQPRHQHLAVPADG